MAEEITVATIGAVVAVVSATLGYFFTKERERQAELRKARQDRIEDRASIYIYFIFQLMEFTASYLILGSSLVTRIYDLQKKLQGIPTSDESEETTKMRQELSELRQAFEKQSETYEAINCMVTSKLYRFSSDVNFKWYYLKDFYRIHSALHLKRTGKSAKKVEDEFRDRALDLFGSLVEEYNKSVYPEYADVFGKGSEHLVLKYIDPEALKRYSENKEKE